MYRPIQLTSNPRKATLVTHSGVFHCDEVMATAILALKAEKENRTFTILRTPVFDEEVRAKVSPDTIVYDIGGGKYDHHQPGGGGSRSNGVPYSSAGLIWREFGPKLVGPEVFSMVDKTLIQGIDALDNGIRPDYQKDGQFGAITFPQLNSIIFSFNHTWNELPNIEGPDISFMRALKFTKVILDNYIKTSQAKVEADKEVSKYLRPIESKGQHILILPKFIPWTNRVQKSRAILFVIYPNVRGGWCVAAVQSAKTPSGYRCPIPKRWMNMSADEIYREAGIFGVDFIHSAGFMAVVQELEEAIAFAQKCITEDASERG